MRFKYNVYRNIFEPGKLTELTETILNDKKTKGLTLQEYTELPTLYSCFNPREEHVTDLENEKEFTTINGKTVLGSDIKSITMLMYLKPRTAYIEFGEVKQGIDSIYSGAVPIPLLGFKRHWGIKYNEWKLNCGSLVFINGKLTQIDDDLEKAFKIDIYLGNTFSSTRVGEQSLIEWTKFKGLLLLSTIKCSLTPEDIVYLRQKGMGNYKGNFATAFGAVNVDNYPIYNCASVPMKLMMTQRWAWYGNHRCSDMICDFQDWDNMPEQHDIVKNAFVGLKPTNAKKLFGLEK